MAALRTEKAWTVEEVRHLIALYEDHPCLYNVKLRDYKDRDKKKAAIHEISAALDTSRTEVTKKLHSLRSQYNRERAKLLKGKSGSGADEAARYKVSWIHFQALQFLRNFVTPKRSRSNLRAQEDSTADRSREEHDEGDEDGMMSRYDSVTISVAAEDGDADYSVDLDFEPQPDSIVTKPSTKQSLPTAKKLKKSHMKEAKEREMFRRAVTVMENAVTAQTQQPRSQDADALFGQYIGSELGAVKDDFVKKTLKHKIQSLIFEAQMSSFASSGSPVVMLAPSNSKGYSGPFASPANRSDVPTPMSSTPQSCHCSPSVSGKSRLGDQNMPSISTVREYPVTFRPPSDRQATPLHIHVSLAHCSSAQPSVSVDPSPVESVEFSLTQHSDNASQYPLP